MRSYSQPLRWFCKKAKAGFRGLFFGEQANYDFGHAAILMEYSNVRHSKKLRGRYQHGWYIFAEKEFWINDYVPTYVWNHNMLEKAHARGFRDFIAIGSSWLYFLELLKNRGIYDLATLRKGAVEELWVYGGHSTATFEADINRLLSFLERAKESQSASKVILLYELDYQKIASYFKVEDFGVTIISIGPRNSSFYSKSHFFNLFHVLTDSQLVITNYPTSLVCYAISLGKDVKWLKDDDFNDAYLSVELYGTESLRQVMRLEIVNASEYRSFAMAELGSDSVKSPNELRQIFFWNVGFRNRVKVFLFLGRSASNLTLRVLKRPRGLDFKKDQARY